MANYGSEVRTDHGFIPFTINIPPEWITDTGNTGTFWHQGTRFAYVYVRGYTGSTEQQCLNERIPAGGSWYTVGYPTTTWGTTLYPTSATTSALTVYVRTAFKENLQEKVYGRIEVYWPGVWQKEIKYNRATTLIGHQDAPTGYKSYRDTIKNYPNLIIATLGGEHMTHRYTTYGGCMDLYYNLKPSLTANTQYYNAEEFHNRQIILDVTASTTGTSFMTTARTLYEVMRTGTSISSTIVTSAPAASEDEIMANKTVDKVGDWIYTGVSCTVDSYSYEGCLPYCEECGETEGCTDDCDEDYWSNDCYYDCNGHTCEINYGEYCLCENADDTPECVTDSYPVKGCIRTELQCIYGSGSDTMIEFHLPKQIPLTAMTCRLEGQIIQTGATNIVGFGSGTSRGDYWMLVITGATGTHPYVYVNTSWTHSQRKALSNINIGEDCDITIGDRYVYDNNSGTYPFSGTTLSTTNRLVMFFVNLRTFRLKRARIYNGDELVSDIVPYKMKCPVTNTGATSWSDEDYGTAEYGGVDMVTNTFYTTHPQRTAIGCLPVGCTGYSGPVESIYSGDFIVPIQNNNTSSAITFRFEGQFTSFSSQEPFCGLTGNTHADSGGNRHILVYFPGTSSGGKPRLFFNYSRNYSSSSYGNYLSGVTLNTDVDLTFSLGKIVDNNNGGAMVYTASTAISSTYRKVTKYFFIGSWALKIYRFRVYSNGVLAYDGTPWVEYMDEGRTKAGLYDSVTNTFTGNYNVNFPGKETFDPCGSPQGETYLFKLINDGATYYQHNYGAGETIDTTLFDQPTKACHTFTGWSPALPATMPAEDFTSTAQYTVNSHTITYFLKDGEHGSSQYVQYTSQTYNCGDTIVTPTITPGSGYEFSGWSLSGNTTMPDQDLNSYGDVHVYVPTYWVKFYSGTTTWGTTNCNSLMKTDYYHAGETIVYPSVGEYCMSTNGWKTSCNGSTNPPATMPANNLNVYLNYSYNTFTVYWRAKKSDASTYTTYHTQTAEYLDSIDLSSGPDLTSYAPSGYHWDGWGSGSQRVQCQDLYINGTFVKDNVVYYTVTYFAGGEYYDQQSYEAGDTIYPPSKPTDSSGCKTYSNWKNVPSTMPADNIYINSDSSNTVYTAAYYINHWNGGTELFGTYSARATEGQGVFLPQNDGYSYTPWQDGSSWYPFMPCSDASAYTMESRNQYTATFYMEDGTFYSSYTAYHLDAIVRPEPYTKPGCTVGWPSSPEVFNAGNVSIYAIEVCPTRTARFYKADGTLYATDTGLQGETITYPDIYSKTGYNVAWPSNGPTTFGSSDVSITAIETIHTWTAYWYQANGTTVLAAQQYNYGAAITAPPPPSNCVWPNYPSTMPDYNIFITPITGYNCTIEINYSIDPSISFSYSYFNAIVSYNATDIMNYTFEVRDNYGSVTVPVSWPASMGDSIYCTVSGSANITDASIPYYTNTYPTTMTLTDTNGYTMAIVVSY